MGLYLCVFDGDDEIDGVEVGSYADFGTFRDTVQAHLEHGSLGSRFPTLMRHSDCDGAWSPDEAAILDVELETIARELETLPPVPLDDGWKTSVARSLGMTPTNRLDCFFDVDGEPAPRPPSSALPLFDGTWPSDSLPIAAPITEARRARSIELPPRLRVCGAVTGALDRVARRSAPERLRLADPDGGRYVRARDAGRITVVERVDLPDTRALQ